MDESAKVYVGNGRYRLDKVIGKGGFGVTYKAFDTVISVYVAVKEFVCDTERELQSALNEAKIAAGFYDLEGIAAARDFFEENNKAYIVMEYVHGISVKHYITQKGIMSGEEVLSKMEPILKSLSKIHEKNVIHRDISIDNLLINDEGRLVLIDFGAAKNLNNVTGKTQTLVFKRGFAPIEQCRENGLLGTWTDVYSLCATMYYMLTGIIPCDSIERMIQDKLTPIREFECVGLTEDAENAIMKGLELNEEDRFQTVKELYSALYRRDCYEGVERLEFKTEQVKIKKNNTLLKKEISSLLINEKNKKKKIIGTVAVIVAICLIGGGTSIRYIRYISASGDKQITKKIDDTDRLEDAMREGSTLGEDTDEKVNTKDVTTGSAIEDVDEDKLKDNEKASEKKDEKNNRNKTKSNNKSNNKNTSENKSKKNKDHNSAASATQAPTSTQTPVTQAPASTPKPANANNKDKGNINFDGVL